MKDIFNNEKNTLIGITPLKRGGASFVTHKLIEVSPSRYEFKSTVLAKLFSLVFIIFPLYVFYFFIQITSDKPNFFLNITENLSEEKLRILWIVAPLIIMLVLFIVGVTMFINFSKHIVFDKNTGFFWKGFKQPTFEYNETKKRKTIRLNEIASLQILKEELQGRNNSFASYELNLVLRNGERMNVVDHTALQSVRKDAQKLAEFLDVPVWDATLQN